MAVLSELASVLLGRLTLPQALFPYQYPSLIPLFFSGNKCGHSTLKDASFEKDTVLAFEAFNPDVHTQPDYLPFVTAARVFLLEADDVTKFYFHNHTFYPGR